MAAAISSVTYNNHKNQNLALEKGIIEPLVDLLDLLKSRNMTVQLKVAMALESLAINNRRTQEAIVALGADICMIKLCEVLFILLENKFFICIYLSIYILTVAC